MVNILVKRGDFENQKVPNCDYCTKSVLISEVFQIVQFAGDQKTALTGESLYLLIRNDYPICLPNVLGNFKSPKILIMFHFYVLRY